MPNDWTPRIFVSPVRKEPNSPDFDKMQDQLIGRLKQQESAALEDLYDAYSSALHGIVLKIVQSQELAQQVLQDTFLKAWRNAGTYDETKGRLFTWLLNIARNTAIDATRTAHYQHRHQTESIDKLVQQPGGSTLNPEHLGVRELVDGLDEKYRMLIEMIYFRGYTQVEVSQETGIPVGTIKTRLRYAMQTLRAWFV